MTHAYFTMLFNYDKTCMSASMKMPCKLTEREKSKTEPLAFNLSFTWVILNKYFHFISSLKWCPYPNESTINVSQLNQKFHFNNPFHHVITAVLTPFPPLAALHNLWIAPKSALTHQSLRKYLNLREKLSYLHLALAKCKYSRTKSPKAPNLCELSLIIANDLFYDYFDLPD